MAILGPIQDAFGQPHLLYVKALVDGCSAVLLGGSLGVGVAFSAGSILLFQGTLTLAAIQLSPLATANALAQITVTGGLLILVIGLGIMGILRSPVGNLLPSVFIAAILA